ncbi:hypothetical protein [Persephonella sp. IF05-L8]|uniref:hypothetical protein n=1 Tax=Persephonella sp. IF05-L8 TaxID=1158338 RepID=UPI0005676311
MKIAVVSFDSELVANIAAELSGAEVKGYMDSLSLVNELKEDKFGKPDIVIYDASGGEIALNALEFFISRPQVKGIEIKALIEKGSVSEENLKKFENLKFYDKETELSALIEELKSKFSENTYSSVETEKSQEPLENVEQKEEGYVPPQDLEALLGETISTSEETEGFELEIEEDISDVGSLLEELNPEEDFKKTSSFETVTSSMEEAITGNGNKVSQEKIVKEYKQPETSDINSGNIRISIELSPEEIKKIVLETAIEKFIEEIRTDLDLDKIKEEIQKDFFDRLEKEMTQSIDQIKEEIKTKLFESIETDLKEKIKESIKEDVTRITTELVKEKLNQVFGGGK